MTLLDSCTKIHCTFNHRALGVPKRLTQPDNPVRLGGSSLACVNCDATPTVADNRCQACYRFRKRTGGDRPDAMITKASKRHETPHRSGNVVAPFEQFGETSMTRTAYLTGQDNAPISKTCSCGCYRTADNFKTTDGLSTTCRQIREHKARRTP